MAGKTSYFDNLRQKITLDAVKSGSAFSIIKKEVEEVKKECELTVGVIEKINSLLGKADFSSLYDPFDSVQNLKEIVSILAANKEKYEQQKKAIKEVGDTLKEEKNKTKEVADQNALSTEQFVKSEEIKKISVEKVTLALKEQVDFLQKNLNPNITMPVVENAIGTIAENYAGYRKGYAPATLLNQYLGVGEVVRQKPVNPSDFSEENIERLLREEAVRNPANFQFILGSTLAEDKKLRKFLRENFNENPSNAPRTLLEEANLIRFGGLGKPINYFNEDQFNEDYKNVDEEDLSNTKARWRNAFEKREAARLALFENSIAEEKSKNTLLIPVDNSLIDEANRKIATKVDYEIAQKTKVDDLERFVAKRKQASKDKYKKEEVDLYSLLNDTSPDALPIEFRSKEALEKYYKGLYNQLYGITGFDYQDLSNFGAMTDTSINNYYKNKNRLQEAIRYSMSSPLMHGFREGAEGGIITYQNRPYYWSDRSGNIRQGGIALTDNYTQQIKGLPSVVRDPMYLYQDAIRRIIARRQYYNADNIKISRSSIRALDLTFNPKTRVYEAPLDPTPINNAMQTVGWRDLLSNAGTFTNTAVSTISSLGRDMALIGREFGDTVRTMSSVMYSAIHLVQALENVMNISDSMQSLKFRLQRYDTSGRSGESLFNDVYNAAQESRTGISELGTLQQRILATNVTGGDATEALRVARLFSKAVVLGGSTAQEGRTALIQLSQGLASNQLGGDELRAIRENAIGITEMLAKGLARGYEQGIFTDASFQNAQIGDLKKLGKAAKLDAKTVVTAISLMEDEINQDFSSMPELFSQTMDKLMNTFKKRLNEFNMEGKGLSRIVKMFQDFEKWTGSEEGKRAIDHLMNMLDRFVEFLTKIGKAIGFVFEHFGNQIEGALDLYLKYLPFKLGSQLAFGKIDRYGNQLGGLIGSGGFANMVGNLAKGGGFASASKLDTINGVPIATNGFLGTLLFHGANFFTQGKLQNKAFALNYVNDLLKHSRSKTDMASFQSVMSMILGEEEGASLAKKVFYAGENKKGVSVYAKSLGNYAIFEKLNAKEYGKAGAESWLSGLGFAGGNITGKEVTKKLLSAMSGLTSSMFGLKGVLGALTSPLAAIAAAIGVIGFKVWKSADNKAEQEDYNNYLSNFNDYEGLNLTDAQKVYLDSKKQTFYNENVNRWGKFIGLTRKFDDDKLQSYASSINLEALKMNEDNLLQKIADNTGDTASNTAGVQELTDEFISNMRDIRTRQFKQQLLMSGTGINNSYSVTITNDSELASERIIQKLADDIVATQQKMLKE